MKNIYCTVGEYQSDTTHTHYMATAGSLAVELYTYTSSGTTTCNGSGLKIFTKSELCLRHHHSLW